MWISWIQFHFEQSAWLALPKNEALMYEQAKRVGSRNQLQVWFFEAGSQWKGQWFYKDWSWMTSVGWQVCACLEHRNYSAVSLGPGSIWQLTFLGSSNQMPWYHALTTGCIWFYLGRPRTMLENLKTLGKNRSRREKEALLGFFVTLNFANFTTSYVGTSHASAEVCANDQEVSEVEAWQALNLSAAYIFFYELGA